MRKLKLRLNEKKSGYRPPNEGNFLGFRLEREGKVALSKQSKAAFKVKVKYLLNARRPRRWKELIEEWRRFIEGWTGYYKLSEWYDLSVVAKT